MPPEVAVKALLVEDNAGDVNLIRLALKEVSAPVELFVVDDGVKALEFLKGKKEDADASRPDFVILDLKLPRKSGLEVLSEIKRDPDLRCIPVFVMTSSHADADVARAYDLQAAAYFVKPMIGFEGVVGTILRFVSAALLPDSGLVPRVLGAPIGGRSAIYQTLPVPRQSLEEMPRTERLRALADSCASPIIGVSLDGTIMTWNRAAEDLYGYTEQEALGQNIRIVVPPEELSDLLAAISAVARGERFQPFDTVRIDRHGRSINVSTFVSPIRDSYGNVVGASLMPRDVTERRATEDRLRLAVESSPNAIVMVDGSGRIVLVNAETERLFGYARAELIGRPIDLLVPERLRRLHPRHRSGFMTQPEPRAMGAGRDLYGLRKDGTEFPVEIGLRPIETPEGTVVLAAVVDISERKQAEERFRLAVESAPNGMVMVEGEGAIVLVNAEAERMFGYSREELIGKTIDMLVPERYRRAHPFLRSSFVAHPEARAMGAGRELHGLRKDGSEFPVEIGLNPIQTSSGTLVLSSIVDITERKRAEERFRLAVESSPNAMVMVDAAGMILLVNAETERLFGYRREELVGKSVELLVPEHLGAAHPKLRAGFVAHPEKRAMGAGRDLRGRRKDGSEMSVEIGLTPIESAQGLLILAAIVDITERKRAEETAVHQTGELARSNAELEQFAYVASHDLQEPLRTVASYTELLARRYGDRLDEEARTYMRFAQEGALRMQHLIEALLAYSRAGTRGRDLVPTEAGIALEQALANLKFSVEESGADIVRGPLPTVRADPMQLIELFQNLVGNAIKFRGKQNPRVEIAARRRDSEWEILVADNGIGIEREHFDRIFQVFQRPHPPGDYPGTGVGLAICKRIVEHMGGRIWVESAPGKGSTFFFSMPDREGVTAEAGALAAQAQ